MSSFVNKGNLHYLKTSKYKDVTISMRFSKPYDVVSKAKLCILTRFLGEYSKLYDTKQKMLKAKDLLYGLNAYSKVSGRAGLLTFDLRFNFINPRYLKDVSFKDFLFFIDEIISRPFFSETLFKEALLNHRDNIKGRLDNPSYYASQEALKKVTEVYKNFEVYTHVYLEYLNDLVLKDVEDCYRSLFSDFAIDIYVIGDVDDDLITYFEKYKSFKRYLFDTSALTYKQLPDIVQTKAVSQSSLNVFYYTPFNRLSNDFYAFVIGNIIFGNLPNSLLFEEIREHQSLCYYIGIQDYKAEGLVRVLSDFDYRDYEAIKKAINEELEKMKNGDFSDNKLNSAKSMILDALVSDEDDPDNMIDYAYANALYDLDVSYEEYAAKIKEVKKEDIIRVFKQYKMLLCYELKGIKNA